jgi:hypothetical protein
VAVALAGLLLGMRFRVPALLAASALLVGAVVVAGVTSGRAFSTIAGRAAALTIELQLCYAAGLFMATVLCRSTRPAPGGGTPGDPRTSQPPGASG